MQHFFPFVTFIALYTDMSEGGKQGLVANNPQHLAQTVFKIWHRDEY